MPDEASTNRSNYHHWIVWVIIFDRSMQGRIPEPGAFNSLYRCADRDLNWRSALATANLCGFQLGKKKDPCR